MNLLHFAAQRRCRRLPQWTAMTALLTSCLVNTAAVAETLQRDPGLAAPRANASAPQRAQAARCHEGAAPFSRVELFFGLSKPGGVITDASFNAFVDSQVLPRFPDGLTLLTGGGQFRDASGAIVVEGAKLLILLIPNHDADVDEKLESIRSDYRRQFQQQSVLRTDATACVSF